VLDRPEDGRREADAAIADWPEGAWYHQHWAWLRAQCFLDLYEGTGASAAERIRKFRPRLKEAMQLRIRTPRFESNYLEGRGAIEALRQGGSREHERTAKARIADLQRERNGLSEVYASLLSAGLTALTAKERTVEAFRDAENKCIEFGMPMHELACIQRQAAARGDSKKVQAAEERLSAMGVRAPARFMDMLAPRVQATR
jgi:hypothetical protein